MINHLFKRFIRMIRVGYPHYFNLVELVKAVEASYMRTPRPGFPPETWCICHIPYGQFFGVKNDIPVYVCDRNFGGRDKIKIIDTYMVHLSFFVRKLAGSESGIFIDHDWRHDLEVTCLFSLVEKE